MGGPAALLLMRVKDQPLFSLLKFSGANTLNMLVEAFEPPLLAFVPLVEALTPFFRQVEQNECRGGLRKIDIEELLAGIEDDGRRNMVWKGMAANTAGASAKGDRSPEYEDVDVDADVMSLDGREGLKAIESAPEPLPDNDPDMFGNQDQGGPFSGGYNHMVNYEPRPAMPENEALGP